MEQKIVGFHLDEKKDWVADLECGHKQHMRHDPPMQNREWINDYKEREKRKGQKLNCKRCDEMGLVIAKAVLKSSILALKEAEMDSAAAAMCREGQIELALDRLQNLDLKNISQSAIAAATGKFGTLDK